MEEPPLKKARAGKSVTDNIDDFIDNIVKSSKNLQPIINPELYDSIAKEKVYVGHIKDAKELSKTIQILNDKIPLKEFQHLKRVRNRDVLLCPTIYVTQNSSIQEYLELNVPDLKQVFEYFKELEVPATAPKLRRQHIECNKVWSCNFHPNSYLEKIAGDKFFTAAEIKTHRMYMAVTFDVAKFYIQNYKMDDTINILDEINVTVVVNPIMNSIVDVAFDNRRNHPLQHSTMLAIDNVAKTQNGGAWNTDNTDAVNNKLCGIDKDLLVYLKQRYNVCFGERTFKSKDEKSDVDGPYLCTGYFVYTIREPCVMCSMALVHARAKRVFFCFDNTSLGALKCKTQLQNVPFLNHRFEVFSGFL
ncbi:probable inactive tRNA-specific adenosine deaminase-like protein 3 [Achroia grisella]|uniref:probable inactive tRNA-specific adenosine deaminase-like protein 3 n=1 Tax=Achroia grisella TaxID=688607 RepID=UPI0027D23630|nr:probable inactive tRNA-specific adenosine deaminase-like protein 3 [Achroia grisella]